MNLCKNRYIFKKNIIFVILLESLKKINIVFYNIKIQNIYYRCLLF